MSFLPLPALIADVGGTNLRFALVGETDAEPRILGKIATSDYATMTEAAAEILSRHPDAVPRSAVFAIAAPVTGTSITLTNADFNIDLNAIADAFSLKAALFLNDFEALAIALPALTSDDLEILHGGRPDPDGSRVVLGPGTGLGAAMTVRGGDGYVPVPGEAGHITFGAETDEDFQIWPHLERRGGCVSPEVVLSGSGLLNLYRAIAISEGQQPGLFSQHEVSAAAERGDKLARRAIFTFLRLLGRSAGDLAVVPWATGGIYLAGGMTDVLSNFISESELVAAVRRKSPHEAEMAAFPIYRIIRPQPALFGIAVLLRELAPISLPPQNRLVRRD